MKTSYSFWWGFCILDTLGGGLKPQQDESPSTFRRGPSHARMNPNNFQKTSRFWGRVIEFWNNSWPLREEIASSRRIPNCFGWVCDQAFWEEFPSSLRGVPNKSTKNLQPFWEISCFQGVQIPNLFKCLFDSTVAQGSHSRSKFHSSSRLSQWFKGSCSGSRSCSGFEVLFTVPGSVSGSHFSQWAKVLPTGQDSYNGMPFGQQFKVQCSSRWS